MAKVKFVLENPLTETSSYDSTQWHGDSWSEQGQALFPLIKILLEAALLLTGCQAWQSYSNFRVSWWLEVLRRLHAQKQLTFTKRILELCKRIFAFKWGPNSNVLMGSVFSSVLQVKRETQESLTVFLVNSHLLMLMSFKYSG